MSASTATCAVWLSQRQLAELLGLSERTLERMRGEGSGPPFSKAGRRVLYRMDDIELWLKQRSYINTAEAKRAMAQTGVASGCLRNNSRAHPRAS